MSKEKPFFPYFFSFLCFIGPFFFVAALIGIFALAGDFIGYLKSSTLPEMDAQAISQIPIGKTVLVEGRLVDQQVVRLGSIILWDCSEGSSDLLNPLNLLPIEWRGDVPIYPSLYLEIEKGALVTEKVPALDLAGAVIYSSTCKGLVNKSWVTLVGMKTAAGQVRPEYIFIGNRQQAISYYQEQVKFLPMMLVLALVSAGISLGFIIPWYVHIKNTTIEPEEMYLPKRRMKRRARRIHVSVDDER